MKRLILTKQSLTIQTAHLYEHLFCMHITTFFDKNALFPQLDYSLNGKTYHGGIIVVDIELYTFAAIKIASQIAGLEIDINETTLKTALSQILAENEEYIESTGYEQIANALTDIQRQPWQDIDAMTLSIQSKCAGNKNHST